MHLHLTCARSNAGAVNNLLSAASQRMEQRGAGLSPAERAAMAPIASDLCPEEPKEDPEAIFSDLVGCKQASEGDAAGTRTDWAAAEEVHTQTLL